jgi:hypothetical protein
VLGRHLSTAVVLLTNGRERNKNSLSVRRPYPFGRQASAVVLSLPCRTHGKPNDKGKTKLEYWPGDKQLYEGLL